MLENFWMRRRPIERRFDLGRIQRSPLVLDSSSVLLVCCVLLALTFRGKSVTITSIYSEEEEQYPSWRCAENPRIGERGRAADGEYTLELAPQRPLWDLVGVLRERPLPRRRVLARLEAVSVRKR